MKKLNFLFALLFLLASETKVYSQSNHYLHFDGVDDFVSLPNAGQLISGSNTISMTGWFWTEELLYGQGMLSIRDGGLGSGEMYLVQLDNGVLECRLVTNTGLKQFQTPPNTIITGQWQHIAWIYDQNILRLYIDGVAIGTVAASGTFTASTKPFTIGNTIFSSYNFLLKGRADEVTLWNKALTQTEVQDMMANELLGNEANLLLYYKFNQGVPNGNNTAITKLKTFSNEASKNADLLNFSLNGTTSNFSGVLNSNYQYIDFIVSNKLITDAPFPLQGTTNSGLPITYTVMSGPASLNNNIVTLNGTAGEVIIKASQAGNSNFDAAEDVFVTISVLDPAEVLVESTILHPLNGDVNVSGLIPIQVAFSTNIAFPELFQLSNVVATAGSETIELLNMGSGHYNGWWTPQSYGDYVITITATNNFGATSTSTVNVNVIQQTNDLVVNATTNVWVSTDVPTVTVESDLPSFSGAYDQIIGKLIIGCPPGGCDPWDRISSVQVQDKKGEWFEIIRYMTPYGVACQSEIDLTDFKSLLRGKTKFRVSLGTQGNGFLYTLKLEYRAGVDPNPFTHIQKLWNNSYQFGDLADLQPTEDLEISFPANTASAKIKLISPGHGWGNNNTNNAAEFSANTHKILVNNNPTFTQYNYNICNPNPDNCSPQAGTWEFNRAGWCPGSIAQFFDFSMTSFIPSNTVSLKYIFDESYIDYCHINNPNCISGQTCTDCADGFNPQLQVASYLISFSQSPYNVMSIASNVKNENLNVYPNPSSGIFYVDLPQSNLDVQVYDYVGRTIKKYTSNSLIGTAERFDLSNEKTGVYIIIFTNSNGFKSTAKVIKE